MAKHAKLRQVGKSKPLADQVYDRLLNLITSPEMPAGSRLSVDALVRELNVSQTPIRQALVKLQTQGLVVREVNVGYSTPPLPDASEMAEIFDFRLMIEPLAAARAAEVATKQELEIMEKLLLDMELISERGSLGNYGKFAQKDDKFHNQILSISGNRIAKNAIQRLTVHNHLFRLHFHKSVADQANEEHREILQAIKNRRPSAAKKAMQSHIVASRNRLEPHF
ncbi:GntR family transcriptional regulator [Marinovum sp. 2_MG-2023]|uniref:GntR family transcriptional regulator n=1 Tax=unclassified Marinovum TaxID=2647166 RepID=UPI0026E172AB|nr:MULTISPECIES: GntR family transcriptional regulator [unclassified Marinovum]MDO6732392.1 GntR family transcriptional regulator [Marinovum sp. 2_MG-2023]MDO6781709.1 GntR family transcriptional regulator [Marinovum sp. 1_MG-2023]